MNVARKTTRQHDTRGYGNGARTHRAEVAPPGQPRAHNPREAWSPTEPWNGWITKERKQNKHSLRQLLLDEVGLMEAADQQMQDELRAEQQMGHGAMPPPQSPR